MSYKRMKADRSVCHDSDFSLLPKDAVIIKTFYKYSYEQISYILEHKYQVIRYKLLDGYNVYMYIDKELADTEYLCFLAHTCAKFVFAYEQGGDLDAKYIIDCFGEFYRLEDTAYLNDGRYDIDNSIAERFFCRQSHGQRISGLSLAVVNLTYERSVCVGIFKEILP